MLRKRLSFRKGPEGNLENSDDLYHEPSNISVRGSSPRIRRIESNHHDPLGLTVIHSPARDRLVDIVFVHGLGGSSRMSWSAYRNPDLFWPQEFLPLEGGINEARILTFGYISNSQPGSRRSTISILEFAGDLLYNLRYAKDESMSEPEDLRMGERPIIFVAHSLGGLIVKEAYVQGQLYPIYSDIIKSFASIIFLSTPHRGRNLSETLNRILAVSFSNSMRPYIAEINNGSEVLQRLNKEFRHVVPRLQIVSFYETLPTNIGKTKTIVIEENSSMIGYPGELLNAIDADHHGVCKYGSPRDPRYISIRNVLKSLVENAKLKVELQGVANQSSRLSFEDILSVHGSPNEDYYNFRDLWVPGTCDWILNDETFNRWVEGVNSGPRVLWIYGDPATGKSILSSFVINHLTQIGFPCHYFFIRYSNHRKRDLSMILRSLACQLAHSTPEYANKLCLLETPVTELHTANFRVIWQRLYKEILLQLKLSSPLYFVIDGVDEAESPGSLIRLLSELHSRTVPLRVLIVSRKTDEISSDLSRFGMSVCMDSVSMEQNKADFRSYIDHEMIVGKKYSYRQHGTAQLLKQARGNFLWLHLAVQKLNTCRTKSDVEDLLEVLLPGMEALYDRMLVPVQLQLESKCRKVVKNTLRWVTCAQRPLSAEELENAVKVDGFNTADIRRTIRDLCGELLVFNNEGEITMIHETAREYLLRERNSNQLSFSIDKSSTHDLLLKSCMLCLTDLELRTKINQHKIPALLDYAASAWVMHLLFGSTTRPDIVKIMLKFFQGPNILTWINFTARRKDLGALIVTSRHLKNILVKLQRTDENKFLENQQSLRIMMLCWARDLVKIVDKFGHILIQNPDSIYEQIPPLCPESSIIYQQYDPNQNKALYVSHITNHTWDDCPRRFSLDNRATTSTIVTSGDHIVVPIDIQDSTDVIIYSSVTFEEQRRITNPERVLSIQVNKAGNLVLTYGLLTTRVWDLATGHCIKEVESSMAFSKPHTLLFVDNDNIILAGSEDRCIRYFSLKDNSTEWITKTEIKDQSLEETAVKFHTCSALSPEGNMIAFGYRGHPVTVWGLDPPVFIGQYNTTPDSKDLTIQINTWEEVIRLTWHPFSGELYGLTQSGQLFVWNPYEVEASATFQTGANQLIISHNGSLIATGDSFGTIKIYTTTVFSLLYQSTSQDPILHISFSTNSRRLYDIRGGYGNIWEPSALVHFAGGTIDAVTQDPNSSEIEFCSIPDENDLATDVLSPLPTTATNKLTTLPTTWSNPASLKLSTNMGEMQAVKQLARNPMKEIGWTLSAGDESTVSSEDRDSIYEELQRLFLEDAMLRPLFQSICGEVSYHTGRKFAERELTKLFRGYCVLLRSDLIQRDEAMAIQFLQRRIDVLVKKIFLQLENEDKDDEQTISGPNDSERQEHLVYSADRLQHWPSQLSTAESYELPLRSDDSSGLNDNTLKDDIEVGEDSKGPGIYTPTIAENEMESAGKEKLADFTHNFVQLRSFFIDSIAMKELRAALKSFVENKPLTDWERKVNEIENRGKKDGAKLLDDTLQPQIPLSHDVECSNSSDTGSKNHSTRMELEELSNVESVDGGFKITWSCCCDEQFSTILEGATLYEAVEISQELNWDIERDGPKVQKPRPNWLRNLLWVFWPQALLGTDYQNSLLSIEPENGLSLDVKVASASEDALSGLTADDNKTSADTIQDVTQGLVKLVPGDVEAALCGRDLSISSGSVSTKVTSLSKPQEQQRRKFMKHTKPQDHELRESIPGENKPRLPGGKPQYICICLGRLGDWALDHAKIQQQSSDNVTDDLIFAAVRDFLIQRRWIQRLQWINPIIPSKIDFTEFRVFSNNKTIEILEKRLPHEPRDFDLALYDVEPIETVSPYNNEGLQRIQLCEDWRKICPAIDWEFNAENFLQESQLRYYKAIYLTPKYLMHSILEGHSKPSSRKFAEGFPRKLIQPLHCKQDEGEGRFGWGLVVETQWAREPMLFLMAVVAMIAYTVEAVVCWSAHCTASVGVSVGMAIWTTIMAVPTIVDLVGKQRGAIK